MINLLPPKDQERIKRTRMLHFSVIAGLFVCGLLLAGLILLLPSLLFLSFHKNSLERQVDIARGSPIFGRAEEIERSIIDLNIKLRKIKNNESKLQIISPSIRDILSLRPQGIFIDTIFLGTGPGGIEEHSITVRGRVGNRDSLLSFIDDLELSPFFVKVHSPVTNLLKENDIEFSLLLEPDKEDL